MLLQQPSYGVKTKLNKEDQFEHVDDILRQMNQRLGTEEPQREGDGEQSSEIAPRVVQQKEDVVFIKNPDLAWRFHKILTFNSGTNMA